MSNIDAARGNSASDPMVAAAIGAIAQFAGWACGGMVGGIAGPIGGVLVSGAIQNGTEQILTNALTAMDSQTSIDIDLDLATGATAGMAEVDDASPFYETDPHPVDDQLAQGLASNLTMHTTLHDNSLPSEHATLHADSNNIADYGTGFDAESDGYQDVLHSGMSTVASGI